MTLENTVEVHSDISNGPNVVANRLAFLLHSSFELFNHFRPVWDLLPAGSFDVLLHNVDKAKAQTLLSRWRCGVHDMDDVLKSGTRYGFLVSNHPVDDSGTPLIKRLAHHNVCYMYSAGAAGWTLRNWNALYDVILTYGPHHAQVLGKLTDAIIVQMGYPRFDGFFTERVDRAELLARYGCDPSRKTVVWLPSLGTVSSVGYFDEEIGALTSKYNVVVKFHPAMPKEQPERVESLRKYNLTHMITDTSDNQPLYQLADYMLFDYGGSPLAGLYADKNFLLLDVPGAEADPILGADSPEIQMRKVFPGLSHEDRRIAQLLGDAETWNNHSALRRQLRQTYFAPHYGFSAHVAAAALMHLEILVENKGCRIVEEEPVPPPASTASRRPAPSVVNALRRVLGLAGQ